MKKTNISDQDLITRKVSLQLNISEDIIQKVMSYEKRSVKEALYKYNSVEMTNFGTFYIRDKMVLKEIEKRTKIKNFLVEKIADPKEASKIDTNVKKLEGLLKELDYLKTKQK